MDALNEGKVKDVFHQISGINNLLFDLIKPE